MTARRVASALAVLAIGVCAVPGLLYLLLDLVELRSTRPFAGYRANDAWTGIHVVNMFVLEYAGPVMVPSMWALVFALRRPLRRRAWGIVLIGVAAVSTLGACLFWLWAFR
jgi:hypothetical protein